MLATLHLHAVNHQFLSVCCTPRWHPLLGSKTSRPATLKPELLQEGGVSKRSQDGPSRGGAVFSDRHTGCCSFADRKDSSWVLIKRCDCTRNTGWPHTKGLEAVA